MVTPERRSHLLLHSCPLSLNGGGEETREPSPQHTHSCCPERASGGQGPVVPPVPETTPGTQ